MKKFVLGFLATLMLALITGCATDKNEEAESSVTVGEQYTIRKLVIPEQKKGALSFRVGRARYPSYNAKDLAPAIIVSEYLEDIAATGYLPLRVREGFLQKRGDQWYLAEWPPEVTYRQFCTGYPSVISNVYYVAKMK